MEVERQNFSSAADLVQKMSCCSVVDTFFIAQKSLLLMLSMSGALLSEANVSSFLLDTNKSFPFSDVKKTSVTEENKDAGETGGGKKTYSDSDSSNESGDEYDEVESYYDSDDDDGAALYDIPGSDEDDDGDGDGDGDDNDEDDEDEDDEENDNEDEENKEEEKEEEEGESDGKKENRALKKKSEKQLDSQSSDPTTTSV